jgi:hypothetical protein
LANWGLVESFLEASTKNNPANAITGVLVAKLCSKFGEDNRNVRLPSTEHKGQDTHQLLLQS